MQTLARHPDWLPRLEAFLAAAEGRRFAWGRWDCCLFAAAGIQALTGADLARGLRGRYRSLPGALRLLARHGGVAGLAKTLAARYGIPAWDSPAQARRGDVVLLEAGAGLGLVLGPGGNQCLALVGLTGTDALGLGPEGLFQVPMGFWRHAWRIG